MTLLSTITFSQLLDILSTEDWRYTEKSFAQLSCKSGQRWAEFVGCLAMTFHSSLSHTSSMWIKSADCAS